MLEIILLLALIWLIIASIEDIKKREIPNWLAFSLIAFVLAFRAFYSVFSSNIWFFLYGLLGLGVFFILANIFYYLRIYGGGDYRLLTSLGVILPIASNLYLNLSIMALFIFISMVVGGVYGLFYSFVLVSLNRKNFFKKFSEQFKAKRKFIFLSLPFFFLSLVFATYFFDLAFFLLSLVIIIFPFLYIYARAVDESCMVKVISANKATVGDWLYEEVKVGRKKIKPYWEGLSEKEVRVLRKYKGGVKVKYGIPFVPVFLISFILFVLLWYSSWSFFEFFSFLF